MHHLETPRVFLRTRDRPHRCPSTLPGNAVAVPAHRGVSENRLRPCLSRTGKNGASGTEPAGSGTSCGMFLPAPPRVLSGSPHKPSPAHHLPPSLPEADGIAGEWSEGLRRGPPAAYPGQEPLLGTEVGIMGY